MSAAPGRPKQARTAVRSTEVILMSAAPSTLALKEAEHGYPL